MFRRRALQLTALAVAAWIPLATFPDRVIHAQSSSSQVARDPGLPLSAYGGRKLTVLCEMLKFYGNPFAFLATRDGDRQAALDLEFAAFSNLASGGVSPLTVGDFLTFFFTFSVTDTGGLTTGFKSGKIKTTFFYESATDSGRQRRIKLGTQKLQFKDGVLTGFLQIPLSTVAKFDDVPDAGRSAADATTKEGRIVGQVKKLPTIPDDNLLFVDIALFWAALGGSPEGAPERPTGRAPSN